MKFWQRMAHQFLKLRRQLRKRSKAIIALAAVVVFFTTYALILPAITEDAETAANDPAMSVGTTSVAETGAAGEGGNGEVTEGSVDQQNPETAEENKEQPAQAETATETGAAENAEASDLISENTTLTDRNAESGYTISAAVTADAKFKNDTKLATSEISKDKEETKDTYQAYLDKAQTALQATNTTVADARFYDISFVSGTEKEEPQAAITTTIQFDNPIELKDGQDIQIAHIDADNNLTILDKTAATVATTETADHKIGSVSFNANQFSVYGVIVNQPKPEETKAESTVSDNTAAVSENKTASENAASDTKNTVSENADTDAKHTVSGNTAVAGGDSIKVNDDVTVKVSYDEKAGLPEGTKLSVKEVSDTDQYAKATKEALGKDVEILGEKYYDISFIKDGKEIEPTGGVNVKITLSGDEKMTAGNDIKVVHFADGKDTPDVLNATVTGGKVVETEAPATKNVVKRLLRAAAPKKVSSKDSDSEVRFTADSFSVYGIVDTEDKGKTKEYRRTYTFQNDDGSEYKFNLNPNPVDGSNTTTDQQIVKTGEDLKSVGTPEAKTEESQGKEFLGWEVTSVSDGVTDLKVGEVITLPRKEIAAKPKDESVTLKARFDTEVYLTFYESDNTTVIYKEKVAKDSAVNLSNYHATAEIPAEGNLRVKSFVGWSLKENDSEALNNSNGFKASQDTTFYPVYKEGYWLYFNANDNDSDVKATFTESVFADKAQTSTDIQPKNPERQGYAFDGWYTDQACTEPFEWGTTLTGNTTLYAKWNKTDTTYKVIIWRQRVTDDRDADAAAKTYDYGESFTENATTGDKVNGSSDSLRKYEGYNTGDYKGFKFASAGVSRTDSTTNVTVAGDGSSVINVYYDRDLITINFSTSEDKTSNSYVPTTAGPYSQTTQYGLVNGQYQQLYYNNGWGYYTGNYRWNNYTETRYIRTTVRQYWRTFTGLYGQPFSMYGYSWPADNGPWMGDNNSWMSFLGQFVLPDDNDDGSADNEMTFTKRNDNSNTIDYYLMNADGSWPTRATYTGKAPGTTFNFSEKFDNYYVSQYRNDDTYGWTNINRSENNGIIRYNPSAVRPSGLQVRYARKTYKVEFYNWATDLNADQSRLYEASLDGLTTPDPSSLTYPGNESEAKSYTFVGWFADKECTTYVSFGKDLSGEERKRLEATYPDITNFVTYETMPGHNLPVYAGWKAIRHTVTFDPQGGTIPGCEPGENYVESVLLGQSIRNATRSNVLQATYTDQNNVTYTLVGWYKENSNGPDTLYNFDDAVTADITLKAHWRQQGQFYVRYVDDDKDATLIQDDPIAYADQSDVKVMSWPTGENAPKVKDGYVFAGWQLTTTTTDSDGKTTSTTTTYAPGQTFAMDAKQAKEIGGKKYITLKALYTQLGTTYITYDANGGSGTLEDPEGINNNTQANVLLNQTITLSNGSGFTRDGYVLAGWDTKANGTGTRWNRGEKVGINDDKVEANGGLSDGGNKLYAIWAPIQKILKVNEKTGDEQKALSGAVFKLTKENSNGQYANVTSADFYGPVEVKEDGYTITSSDQAVNIGALKQGNYKLTETTAPAGYIVSTNDIIFSVDNKGSVTLGQTDNAQYDSDSHIFTIENKPGEALPKTGGTGTRTFTILGLLFLTTAGALITLKKKSIL